MPRNRQDCRVRKQRHLRRRRHLFGELREVARSRESASIESAPTIARRNAAVVVDLCRGTCSSSRNTANSWVFLFECSGMRIAHLLSHEELSRASAVGWCDDVLGICGMRRNDRLERNHLHAGQRSIVGRRKRDRRRSNETRQWNVLRDRCRRVRRHRDIGLRHLVQSGHRLHRDQHGRDLQRVQLSVWRLDCQRGWSSAVRQRDLLGGPRSRTDVRMPILR